MYISKMKTLSDSGGANGETISPVRRRTDGGSVLQNRGTGFDNLFFASGSFGRIIYTTKHRRRGREHVCIDLFFLSHVLVSRKHELLPFLFHRRRGLAARARRGSWFREAGRTERIGQTTDMTHTRRAHGDEMGCQSIPHSQYPF